MVISDTSHQIRKENKKQMQFGNSYTGLDSRTFFQNDKNVHVMPRSSCFKNFRVKKS